MLPDSEATDPTDSKVGGSSGIGGGSAAVFVGEGPTDSSLLPFLSATLIHGIKQ